MERKRETNNIVKYAIDFFNRYSDEDGSALFVTNYEIALDFKNTIENEYEEIDVLDKCNYEIESEDVVYIEKISDDIYKIKNFFDKDGEIQNIIGADYVLIQDDILIDEIINEIIYADEYMETVKLVEDNEDCNHNCEGNNINNENSVIDDETEEFLFKKTFDFVDKGFTPDQLFDFVNEIYYIAYEDGQKSNMLELRDMLDDIINED